MIKQVEISNFYSFGEARIPIHRESNVLVGINGSGKSNFLRAIQLLHEGVIGIGLKKQVLEQFGSFQNMFFKGKRQNTDDQSIRIAYTFDGKKLAKTGMGFAVEADVVYTITLIPAPSLQHYFVAERLENTTGLVYLDFHNGAGTLFDGTKSKQNRIAYTDFDPRELVLAEISDSDRYLPLTTLKKAIRDMVVYDYFDTTPRSLIRKPMLPTSDKRLSTDGSNLPQILNTIKINHKDQYRKIIEALKEVNPNITGFDFNFIGGNIELMLEEKGLNSAVHVSNISDGTLRYLCHLAIIFNPNRGNFVCIDEPETGLHPDMLHNVAVALREAAESSTFVISTHSENFLNSFELENIRVFEKDENNATSVKTFSADQFTGWYEDFSLGQMWKQGDLGGVRYGG